MDGTRFTLIEQILKRKSIDSGFFESFEYSEVSSVATSWAILACAVAGVEKKTIKKGREYLASIQKEDGRICVTDRQPAAFWPTSLTILAWQGDIDFKKKQEKAVKFLLSATGYHPSKEENSPMGHDASIRGWPWSGGTHSWIEPTALAILALKTSGHGKIDRVKEGIEMIMDRQLSHGGWNYGNTTVFGKELLPMPDSTAIALCALAGSVSGSEVEKSIHYLRNWIKKIKAPFSLGWGILGLSAWDEKPDDIEDKISNCLKLQNIYGEYRTSLLCLLLISYMAPRGFSGIFQDRL